MESRHGDIQIQKLNLEKIPKGWVAQDPATRGVVLAEGERTGHAHVIAATAIAILYRKAQEEYALLEIKRAAKADELRAYLDHEEHHRQVYEPGIYRVGQKRQYVEDDELGWAPVSD